MPGYTKEQLQAKGATIANYVLCDNCGLYWHTRAYQKHLRPAPNAPDPKERAIAIIHPAWDRFLGLLVDLALKRWTDDQEKIRRGEPIEAAPEKPGAKIDWPPPSPDDPELLTVEEAIERLGVSREEIDAEFAKNMIPFEFTVPPGPRARRRAAAERSNTAGATPSPEPAQDAGAAVVTEEVVKQRDALKDRHAALLKRRAKLDEDIAKAERELSLAQARPPPSRPSRSPKT